MGNAKSKEQKEMTERLELHDAALSRLCINAESAERNNRENETLQLVGRKMDTMDMEVGSLHRKINILYGELLDFEKKADEAISSYATLQQVVGRIDTMRQEVESLHGKITELNKKRRRFEKNADEAISTYASNVLLIMLVHGLGSAVLQVTYPYTGAGVSFVTVVSFFFAFMVTYIATLNKHERMSESEKDLQRQQMELQNEVACFGGNMGMACSDGELNKLALAGTLTEVWNKRESLRRCVAALERERTRIIELSKSEYIRQKSLNQITMGAVLYGLCFPMIAYYFRCFAGLPGTGVVSAMRK